MLIKSLRPYYWVKNSLLAVPLLVSHKYTESSNLWLTFYAFVIFSMTASAAYLFNDCIDQKSDRFHPIKKFRGLASGLLDQRVALSVSFILTLIALGLSIILLPAQFFWILLIYLLATTAYTLKIKYVPILDVLFLSIFYVLRLLAGAFAISVVPSSWLMNFSLFIFFSLALMKRYNELNSHSEEPALLTRGYKLEDIPLLFAFGVSTAVVSILILCLYVNDEQTSLLYKSPHIIWFACPVLFYWIVRSWLISHRKEMGEDTLLYAIKDRASLVSGLLILIILSMAKYYE